MKAIKLLPFALSVLLASSCTTTPRVPAHPTDAELMLAPNATPYHIKRVSDHKDGKDGEDGEDGDRNEGLYETLALEDDAAAALNTRIQSFPSPMALAAVSIASTVMATTMVGGGLWLADDQRAGLLDTEDVENGRGLPVYLLRTGIVVGLVETSILAGIGGYAVYRSADLDEATDNAIDAYNKALEERREILTGQ